MLLEPLGWRDEGMAWLNLASFGASVYRLYNPWSGDHRYTTDEAEYELLALFGWCQETRPSAQPPRDRGR